MHRVLNQIVGAAARQGLVPTNVVAAATPPPGTYRAHVDVLSPDELKRFLKAARADEDWPMWATVATTGLRRGELVGLTWLAVDFEGRTLEVIHSQVRLGGGKYGLSTPKSHASRRRIPLMPMALHALAEQRRRQEAEARAFGATWSNPDDLVFTRFDGQAVRPISGDGAYYRFRRLLRTAGLRHVRVHDLRHTFGTTLIEAGYDARTVADLMGHSTPSFTLAVYTHPSDARHRQAIDDLERVIDPLEATGDGKAME